MQNAPLIVLKNCEKTLDSLKLKLSDMLSSFSIDDAMVIIFFFMKQKVNFNIFLSLLNLLIFIPFIKFKKFLYVGSSL